MKKVIIILVFILIIAMSGFYIYSQNLFNKKQEVNNLQVVKQEEVKNEITPEIKTKEVKIGDIVLDVPLYLIIEELEDKSISIRIPGIFIENGIESDIENDDPNHKTTTKYKKINLFFYKNANEASNSLEEWVRSSVPPLNKYGEIATNQESIKINSFNGYLLQHFAKEEGTDFQYYDYDKEEIYLSNKKDIYEISIYRQADPKDVSLNTEEKKSIENYEKIVDEIIKSIRFVD